MKETRAKKTIELYGSAVNVNYDQKTLNNIRNIMKNYREYRKHNKIFNFQMVGKGSIKEEIPSIYKMFISPKPVGECARRRMVFRLLNDAKTEGIIRDALSDVKAFRLENPKSGDEDLGELYYKILQMVYFGEKIRSDVHTYMELELEQHKYNYRKEEAIMLFGVFFWKRCLDSIEDCQTVMEKVEEELAMNS